MLIFSILFILISIAANNRRDTTIFYSRLISLILAYSIIIFYINKSYVSKDIVLFNGLFYLENYTFIFINFIIILSTIIILLISFKPRKLKDIVDLNYKSLNTNKMAGNSNIEGILKRVISNENSEQFRIEEYPLILMFCILGTIFLISSTDVISIFLSIELQSYSLYLISAIYRNSENSVSASLMYFLLGSLSSCFILLGISLLYIYIGNTNLENIFIVNSIVSINNNYYDINHLFQELTFNQYFYIQVAFVIMSIGFLFKISAAPFHF
jgi:NADH-ubiquinone oxidoreductase chain 2